MELLSIPLLLNERTDLLWTFLLLVSRFTGLLMLLPGLGMGVQGLAVRLPAILILAFVSVTVSPVALLPVNPIMMGVQIASELMLGAVLGSIPMMMVAGVQMAAQLASTSMGLNASNLIDPTLGIQAADLARIFGDVVIIMFLFIGGHHVVIHAAAGLGEQIIPGTFIIGESSLQLFIERSAHIFEMGLLLSSPVIVALLLTQFVMGLITRAVPTVNVFIMSFPLTIAIGLVLSILAFPDIMKVMQREITGVENAIEVALQDTSMKPIPAAASSTAQKP